MQDHILWIYYSGIVFLLGACIGSFLNVCIHRIPLGESVVTPRSHCPVCGKLIVWYDNIPLVSYLILRARCRHCAHPIKLRYWIVELLTALLFLMVWRFYGFSFFTPIYWLMLAGLILGTFVDFEYMIIPDRVTLGGIIAGLVISLLYPPLHCTSSKLWSLGEACLGATVGAGLLWIVSVVGRWVFKKEAMGMGDVKLLGALGAFLGWQAILFIILFSSLVGTMVGLILIFSKSKEWQSRIPYGPYLSLAATAWIFWGWRLWNLYIVWLTSY